ncbi:MAG: hypothetical protein H6797_02260 [Candidatus Nomurabacteria bacterium]|nr:MAG: hypothetical protein H6797_02260 [Candidatus Nomurabacteria bacterium]
MSERNDEQVLLPVVSEETVDVRVHDFAESDSREYVGRMFGKFMNEQPHLAEVVTNYISRAAQSNAEAAKMATVAIVMYEHLSIQAEVDELDRQFNSQQE